MVRQELDGSFIWTSENEWIADMHSLSLRTGVFSVGVVRNAVGFGGVYSVFEITCSWAAELTITPVVETGQLDCAF